MSKLYELTGEYLALSEQLEESGMDNQTIIDTLNGSAEMMNIEEKAGNIVKMVKNWESELLGYDAEIKRITERKRLHVNNIDNVKNYLKSSMEAIGIGKIKVGTFSITLAKNPVALKLDSVEHIPAEYMDIRVEPNKGKIKDALKNDVVILGCELTQGVSLRIK